MWWVAHFPSVPLLSAWPYDPIKARSYRLQTSARRGFPFWQANLIFRGINFNITCAKANSSRDARTRVWQKAIQACSLWLAWGAADTCRSAPRDCTVRIPAITSPKPKRSSIIEPSSQKPAHDRSTNKKLERYTPETKREARRVVRRIVKSISTHGTESGDREKGPSLRNTSHILRFHMRWRTYTCIQIYAYDIGVTRGHHFDL